MFCSRNKFTPFQNWRNNFHMAMSFWKAVFNRMWWCGCWIPPVKWIMRWRKARLGATTRQANCNVPINDRSSLSWYFFRKPHAESAWRVRWSLSSGRFALISQEFRVIPRNSRDVAGLKVVLSTRGTSRSVKRQSSLHSEVVHCEKGARTQRERSRLGYAVPWQYWKRFLESTLGRWIED